MSARWGPALVALVLALAVYAPALRPDRQLAGRDLLLLFEPLHRTVAGGLREGRLPERDALRGAGTPLVPDPLAQVLYPPSLVRAALPFDLGWALWFPLHAALAGAGAGHLARRLGASPRAACLAAAGATLAGPLLSACRTPNLLAAAAWTPWFLAGFIDLLQAFRPRAVALSAIAVGMIVLAGGAPLLVILAPGLAALLVVGARRPEVEVVLAAGRLTLATALGVALAGAHLLPFLAWKPHTPRAAAIDATSAGLWSMHPKRLVECVVPGLSPGTSDAWLAHVGESFAPFAAPLHPSVHLGLPIVVLAGLAFARRRAGRAALGLGIACLLWLLVALGTWTPVFELLRSFPVFDSWRYPEKAVLPIAVVLPALAAVGLRGLAPRARAAAFVATVGLGLLGPLVDRNVLFTLPRALIDDSPVARALRDAEDAARRAGSPPGRFLRLARPRLIPHARDGDVASWTTEVRAAQVEVLHEDLPVRFGMAELVAYGPMISARLEPYLRSVVVRDPVRGGNTFDLQRLADDACVAHVLQVDGTLIHRPVPPRARLVGAQGEVRIGASRPERLELTVEADAPASLYVAEGFIPGAWHATVDGAEAPVEEARTAFLSLPVPAGRHAVVLEYRTPRLGAGLALSALALVAIVALAVRR